MERRKLPRLKTYGKVYRYRTKYDDRVSREMETRSPLMSWNDLVNKSDSFDRLTRSSGDHKGNVKASPNHGGSTDENGRSVKKRRLGLSLRKKRQRKETSPNRQSISPKQSPCPSTRGLKPYPPISPIKAPADLEEVSQMSHECKIIYDNFIKVKEHEQEQIVKAFQSILKVDSSPDEDKDEPKDELPITVANEHLSADKCRLTFTNFEARVAERAVSTPLSRRTASALTFPSSQFGRNCKTRISSSDGAEKLQPLSQSSNLRLGLAELQPRVRLERMRTTKCESLVSDNDVEAVSEKPISTRESVELLSSDGSSEIRPSSLGEKRVSFPRTASARSELFASDVRGIKNDSEATTVPMESQLSFTASSLKSGAGLNCSLLQQSLMSLCHQPTILDFQTCFPKRQIGKCSKVGEGTYGEVFSLTVNTELLILKVVPFEGDFEVNGATQQKFQDVQNEAVISRVLSDLRVEDRCSTFIRLIKTYCIKGEYPTTLLKAWQKYDEEIGSENENPKVFDKDQLYMVFVYENGGSDLEKYKFSSAAQVRSTFLQLCCALAVAEEAFQFEHRDLHWGNVLVSKTDAPIISFKLSRSGPIDVRSEGVAVRIIDYSICRLQNGKSETIYTHFPEDDALFTGQGDYQFEVYRMMKALNNNNWRAYNPKTNVYWLDYILETLDGKVKCCRSRRIERSLMGNRLKTFRDELLAYDSSLQFVEACKLTWETT